MHLTAETRLNAILDGTGAGTWEYNLDTGEIIFNERWATMLGYTLEELSPLSFQTWEKLSHPTDIESANQALTAYLSGDAHQFECVVRMLHKDGDWRYIHTRGTLFNNDQTAESRWLMGTHLDVTREKLSQHQMEQLAKSLPGIIYTFVREPGGRYFFSYLSEKTWDFYGLTAEECLDDPDKIFNLIHPDDLPRVHESIAVSAQTLDESRPEKDADGRISWHGMTINIDTEKNLELELEQLSITDELTGLYNRRYMLRKLQESVAQGERYGDTFSLISLDIDFFKTINDSYGHPTGDAVLQRFADIIESRTRKSDIVARTGGEEFIIFMPNTGLSEAGHVAESLRIALQTESFVSDEGETFGITFSAGVVNWSGAESQTTSVRDLLSACDQSMYAAKRAGRNRVVANGNGE